MNKVFFKKEFLLGLLSYLRKIDKSILSREAQSWDIFIKFFDKKIKVDTIIDFLGGFINHSEYFNKYIPKPILDYINLPNNKEYRQMNEDSKRKFLFSFWDNYEKYQEKKVPYYLRILKKTYYLEYSELCAIYHVLRTFKEILDREEPKNYDYTGLRVPINYLYNSISKSRLTKKEINLTMKVEYFYHDFWGKSDLLSVEELFGTDWVST